MTEFRAKHGKVLINLTDVPSPPDNVYSELLKEEASRYRPTWDASTFWNIVNSLVDFGYIEIVNDVELKLTNDGKFRREFFIKEQD